MHRRPGAARLTSRIAALVLVSAAAGVVGSGLTLPAVTVMRTGLRTGVDLLDSNPTDLQRTPIAQRSVMLAADGSVITTLYQENRVVVPLQQISPWARQAVVAIEDSRFFQHGAIDPRGVLRAVVNNGSGRSIQGASTLTQQYVKNLLLERALLADKPVAARAAVARTVARKLNEIKLAITLEKSMTKQQILQGYLNIVPFGGQTYGIEAAAERYFSVPASRLDLGQAATLAGMVQRPNGYDPINRPAASIGRRNLVLERMQQLKMITTAQASHARAAPLRLRLSLPPNGCAQAMQGAFFCDAVLAQLLSDPGFAGLGHAPTDRQSALLTGGLTIRTTLDPATQVAATRAVDRGVPPGDPSQLGAAAVTVEPGTGSVLALTENRTLSLQAGPGLSSVDYATDRSDGGSSGFQTGSTFKPFTLATWLARWHSLSETVDGTKRSFPYSHFTACGRPLRGTKPYHPGNSEGNETGRMSALAATVNSVNVAYVDMESRLDLCDIAATAERLGVHLAQPEQECSTTAPRSTALPACLPSLTLGVKQVSPLTMASAYAAFAAGGVFCRPMLVNEIRRAGAPAVGVPPVRCGRAIPGRVASEVNTALHQVLTRGTARAVGPLPNWPSAGKTGTTDGPYDSWFVGYTAQRSTAVWVADPGRVRNGQLIRRQLRDISVAGQFHATVFGATLAAPIWYHAMLGAMRGLPAQQLP